MLSLSTVFALILLCQGLQMRHQLACNTTHQSFLLDLQHIRATVWLLIILVVVGVSCWYFRGCFDRSSRQETHIIIVPNNSPVQRGAPKAQSQVQVNRVQAENKCQKEKTVESEYKVNNVAAHFKEYTLQKSQPNQTQIVNSDNPYITQKEYESRLQPWKTGDDFLTAERTTQKCGLCSQISKNAQKPRIVLNCREDHCFHVSCLSEHREKVISQMQGNGLYKCPSCKHPYSPNTTLYCNSCRKMQLPLNLSSMGSSGRIDLHEMQSLYGSSCQNCRT